MLLPLPCLLSRKTSDLALPKQSKLATTGTSSARGSRGQQASLTVLEFVVETEDTTYSLCLSRFPHSRSQTSESKTPGQDSNQSLAMSTQTSNPPRIGEVSEKYALDLTFQTEISIKPPFLPDLGPNQGRFSPFDGHEVDLQVAVSPSREMKSSKYTMRDHGQLEADEKRRRKRCRSTIFVTREENSLPKRRKVCEPESASFSTVEDSDGERQAHDEQGLAYFRRVHKRVDYKSKQLGRAAELVSAISGNTKEVPSTTPPSSESSTRPPPILPNKIASISAIDSITSSKGAVQMLAERSGLVEETDAVGPFVFDILEHRLNSIVPQARKEVQIELEIPVVERTNRLGQLGS
jgi:hypothetical protein